MANLENVSADDLRETLAKVDDGDAVKRLTAAIKFKEIDELSQKSAAELYGFSSSWASKWFQRLERLEEEPFEEVVYGEPRDRRSRELTEQGHEQFIEALNNPPEKSGIDAPAWSVPLARHYLREEFDVEYCERHVRRFMSEAGLLGRQPDRNTTSPTSVRRKPGKKGSKKAQQFGRRIHNLHD